ncbi:DNA repair protein Rev1 isoform X2 [Daktulosphaira vitifoliae]|uniref:DNA repair protein Rev1 isoform X2 n=1 Tax=Daktulosphaira vitifoliae TaxID=58002 RepID=UPI0021AAC103|nr:DNA repair protein Rev1 isoform X2 [Daktulosphaira vitifoliae]
MAPSADELKHIMMENGGVYHHYHRPGLTTHIIASNLPNAKLKLLKQYKIVKPEWISDSLKKGKLLNYSEYLLFIDKPDQPKLDFPLQVKNSSEPSFLSEFYNNSRLHLISTMATTFKKLVNETRKNNNTLFPGRLRLKNSLNHEEFNSFSQNKIEITNKIIMHIDMDCFFVSVGLLERPELQGMPIAVTHAKTNSSLKRDGVNREAEIGLYYKRWNINDTDQIEDDHFKTKSSKITNKLDGINTTDSMAEIACCSYEARRAGIKNGMLVGQAMKICPELKLIPYNFDQYKKVAHILYTHIMNDYTLDVEAVSCDELYLDCTEILETTKISPLQLAHVLRNEIKEKTNCPCSVGIGPNCLLARLATKKAKPNGQFYLGINDVMDFLANINISDLPGVGRNTSHKLSLLGVNTCSELRSLSLETLQTEFGKKVGQSLFKHSRGEDDRNLNYDYRPKSVSAEVNYGIRFQNKEESQNFIKQLCEEVEKRLDDVEMVGKTVTLKLMIRNAEAPKESAKFLGHGFCDHITKSSSLMKLTSNSNVIFQTIMKIIDKLNIDPKELRGIGIQINRLERRTIKKGGQIEHFITNMKIRQDHNPLNNIQIEFKPPKSADLNDFDKLSYKFNKSTSSISSEKSKPIVKMFKSIESKSNKNSSPLLHSNTYQSLNNINVSQVDQSFLEALPEDIRLELENDLRIYKKNELFNGNNNLNTNNIFEDSSKLYQQVNIDQMKEFMDEWILTELEPKDCDNKMVTEYLCCLIKDNRMEDAYELLRRLYRLVKIKDQYLWKQSYFFIVKNMQEIMLKLYNAKLKVETVF